MVALEIPPHFVDLGGDAAQIGDDEIVLRIEVAVERHLVGAGSLRDCFDPHAADAVPMKQILAAKRIRSRGRTTSEWATDISFPQEILIVSPRLTTVLPVGNVRRYRPVTFLHTSGQDRAVSWLASLFIVRSSHRRSPLSWSWPGPSAISCCRSRNFPT